MNWIKSKTTRWNKAEVRQQLLVTQWTMSNVAADRTAPLQQHWLRLSVISLLFFFFCFYSSSSILRSGNSSLIYLGVFMLIISILIPLWLEILHNSININFYFFLNPIWILVFNFSNLFMCCMKKLYNFTSYTTIV